MVTAITDTLAKYPCFKQRKGNPVALPAPCSGLYQPYVLLKTDFVTTIQIKYVPYLLMLFYSLYYCDHPPISHFRSAVLYVSLTTAVCQLAKESDMGHKWPQTSRCIGNISCLHAYEMAMDSWSNAI